MTKVTRSEARASIDANLVHTATLVGAFPKGAGVLQAIRRNCMDCTGGQPKEVALCPVKRCALWPYRFGKNPMYGREK